MTKILSQAGNSLADIYDVKGSIAGIDELETHDLAILHEVGATVFSERFATTFRRLASGDVAQNTDLNATITNLPGGVTRLLSLAVFSDAAVRLNDLTIVLRAPVGTVQEIPIWNFSVGNSDRARFSDAGVDATFDLLHGNVSTVFLPNFIGGSDQTNPDMVSDIALRGRSTGFGAGTVFAVAVLHFAFPFVLGTRSRGLPIPSW